jgi:hypothetical protein
MSGAIRPLLQYAFMARCLVKKHRDNFTFTFTWYERKQEQKVIERVPLNAVGYTVIHCVRACVRALVRVCVFLVTTAWRVLGLRMEKTASRYGW